jgi:phage gpG-like protein
MVFRLVMIGDKDVVEKFTTMGLRATHAQPAMLQIVEIIRRAFEISMTAQGRRGGGSWQQLKPDTIRRKAKKGLDPRTEFATHALYESLTRTAAGSRVVVTDSSLSVGSDFAYARTQQFGLPSKNVPARPLITIVEGDRRDIAKVILAHVVG